ncbi:MAG: restriction endonuclease [Halioglobus sp.]
MVEFSYQNQDLVNPVLFAFHAKGGSGSNDEILEEVISSLELSNEQVDLVHKGNKTKLAYRIDWARTYLKNLGLLENSSRGVWALTGKGQKTNSVTELEIAEMLRSMAAKKDVRSQLENYVEDTVAKIEVPDEIEELVWEQEIIDVMKAMPPEAFERLCQRFLRELGFVNVEVTGRGSDGGIDGVGSIKLGGVLSFTVVFQSKRYSGAVGAPVIRDFRGAMIGRADKGLLFTTGSFTRDAVRESQRDGAPPIDLIDGNEFAEHLKNLRLGVDVEMKEHVHVNTEWFEQI